MRSNTKIKEYELLQQSANTQPERIIFSLCDLLGQRKLIAQMILRGNDKDKEQMYKQLYQRINEDICKLISI